jgi:biotin carboxylase
MRLKPIPLFLVIVYTLFNFGHACEKLETIKTNGLTLSSSAAYGVSKVAKEDQFYLLLSARSPAKVPLHKILSDIKPDRLLLLAGEKFFSETEKEKLAPFFNTIVRVKDYRNSGNLEMEAYKLYEQKPFHKIIAYHEYDLLRAAKLREFFGLEGQNYQSALAFRNKIVMKDILQKAGIKVPNYSSVNSPFDIMDFARKNGFPVVVKPIMGTGGDRVTILRSLPDVEDYARIEKAFNDTYQTDLEVESYVEGVTYHVDGFIKDDRIIASWPSICLNHAIDLKVGKYVAHHHLEPQNPMVERLNRYAELVIKSLPTPSNTAFLLELFYDKPKDEFIFCEMATRVGGGVKEMWPEAFGIDLEDEFIRMQAGLKLPEKLDNFFETIQMTPHLKAISGWIIFPKRSGVLESIQKTTPFSWVKEYIVRVEPGIVTHTTANVSDSLASAFLVADSEKQFEYRVVQLAEWLNKETIWGTAVINQEIISCLESCEQWTCQCGCIMDSQLAQAYKEACTKCTEECRKQIMGICLPKKTEDF